MDGKPHVERKMVARWYVEEGSKRKPYGTRYTAYRSVARRLLRIEVFGGEYYPLLDDRADEIAQALPGYEVDGLGEDNLTDAQRHDARNRAWDELMAVKFPHTNVGLCSLNANGACRRDGLGPDYYFVFKSCKAAADRWIHLKILELQAEDEAKDA